MTDKFMEINGSKNIWLTGIYILFLLLVFILFAVIRNSVTNGNAPVIAYIILFIMLIPGSLLYYWSYKNYIDKNESLTVSSNEQQPTNQQEVDTAKVEVIETSTEDTIDIKKLLPKEKNDPEKYGEEILQNLAAEFQISQGLFYIKDFMDETYKCFGQYAYYSDRPPVSFKFGETLPGQAVKNKNIVTLSDIPDKYMTIASGLGESSPRYLTFVPLLSRDEVTGLIEFATFTPISPALQKALKQLSEKIGESLTKMIKK